MLTIQKCLNSIRMNIVKNVSPHHSAYKVTTLQFGMLRWATLKPRNKLQVFILEFSSSLGLRFCICLLSLLSHQPKKTGKSFIFLRVFVAPCCQGFGCTVGRAAHHEASKYSVAGGVCTDADLISPDFLQWWYSARVAVTVKQFCSALLTLIK